MRDRKQEIIRHATMNDLEAITELEAKCFPKNQAAAKEDFIKRLQTYPDYFWLLELDRQIVSMVNGMVSDSPVLLDEMYKNSCLHDENASWQMIFGVETSPKYREKGYAGKLLQQVIADAKRSKRKGVVLTCKSELVPYYEKFGFLNEGLSESRHGGENWYQMKIVFEVIPVV